MQISAINSAVSFQRHNVCNQGRIQQLEQKQIAIQAASEGFNASLSTKDAYELELRREKQELIEEQAALQWATEGCNASLCSAKLNRIVEIDKILEAMCPAEECECHSRDCFTPIYVDNRPDDIRYWNC